MTSLLEQLKQHTVVVADSGDFNAIADYQAEDATTNPSLILNALQSEQGAAMIEQAASWAKQQSSDRQQQLLDAADYLAVAIGQKLLAIVPGRVSSEVDARLSYDTEASVARARKLIAMYQQQGIAKERILIKLASTWQGIRAAEQLEKEGINCNLTLLFSFAQACACAEAGVFLISPFVGRILDWYNKNQPADYSGDNDPGVQSVKGIYDFYKKHGYSTVVMGASFRNSGEILSLAGCDRLTISPALLDELANTEGTLEVALKPASEVQAAPTALSESEFLWQHNQDAMAVEKLAEGIRNFAIDQEKLEQQIAAHL